MQVLIIDQGSIIDRIDYNMEKTAEQTQQVNTRARTERERERDAASDHLRFYKRVGVRVVFVFVVPYARFM